MWSMVMTQAVRQRQQFYILAILLFLGLIFAGSVFWTETETGSRDLGRMSPSLSECLEHPVLSRPPEVLEPAVCEGPNTHAVLFIPSRPGNSAERAAVRETWGFHARLCNVRIIFGFGIFNSPGLRKRLQAENAVYGDLLQVLHEVDSYHNQARLVLGFFEWGARNCNQTQFMGKADEDAWLFMPAVMQYLKLPEARSSVLGHYQSGAPVNRFLHQKWRLTKEDYPNDTYPPYADGQLYVFASNLIPKVLAAAKTLRIHWIDDVFFSGQVREMLQLKVLHIPQRADMVYREPLLGCPGEQNIIIHAANAELKRAVFYDPCMNKYHKAECTL